MAVPRTNATSVWFEWGIDRSYGNTTRLQGIGSGVRVVRVSETINGLIEGGVYHFRLVASNAVGVVPGFDFMFTTGMRIQQWGSFRLGYPLVPQGLTNVSAVACGDGHGLAIRNDGTVAAWSMGWPWDWGETNVPPGLSNVVAVCGGFGSSFALKEDGTVVGWGKFYGGIAPNPPDNLTNVIAVSAGATFAAALKADGTVVAWGRNYSNAGPTNIPPDLKDVVGISCGIGHIVALKADGTIRVWGDDSDQLAGSSATNLVAVASTELWNLGLRGDGSVLDWGSFSGTGVPKPTNLTNVVAIATGSYYAEVLKANGTLVGWGDAMEATNIAPGLSNVVALTAGFYHRLGLAPINLGPKGRSKSFWGPRNMPLTISLVPIVFFDPNGDALTFQITSLPTKGKLYQYTDNGPGLAIDTPGTVVTDVSRVVFVPELDAYGVNYDSFNVMANDGEFTTTSGPLNVSIVPPPIIQSASFVSAPPAHFVLSFTGLTNGSYNVLRSDSLGSEAWFSLNYATQISAGQFSFSDYSVTNSQTRFYRIHYP